MKTSRQEVSLFLIGLFISLKLVSSVYAFSSRKDGEITNQEGIILKIDLCNFRPREEKLAEYYLNSLFPDLPIQRPWHKDQNKQLIINIGQDHLLYSQFNDSGNFIHIDDIRSVHQFWSNHYLSHLQLRGDEEIITSELYLFELITNFKNWNKKIFKKSRIKQGKRIIYHKVFKNRKMAVAQSVDENRILETEVIIESLRNSDNIDFYAYNEDGKLSNYSKIKNTQIPLWTCAACHFDNKVGAPNFKSDFLK